MITDLELDDFAEIIDDCRTLLTKTIVYNNISFKNALFQLYSKSVLTMCEIYTLLKNGYPEGSMALSRNLFETLVIMNYLYDNQTGQDLINRFFDDYRVKTCQDDIAYLKWCIDNHIDSEQTASLLLERELELKMLHEKYKNIIKDTEYFKQYWWIEKNTTFNSLRKSAGYSENAFYKISCYRVHAGITGSIVKLDDSEEGVLIGSCENGKEIPMIFSLMSFQTMTYTFFGINKISVDQVLNKIDILLNKVRSSKLNDSFAN